MFKTSRYVFNIYKELATFNGTIHRNVLWRTSNCTNCRHYATKLSYTHGAGEIPLKGKTIGNLLQSQTELTPDRDAVVFVSAGIRKSFSQLLEESDRLAAGLLELGVKKGDRVGIWGPNSLEWVLTQYATARAGIILVNINPLYRSFELEYALKLVQCKMIVAAETFKDQNYYDILLELVPELSTCKHGQLKSNTLPDLEHVVMIGEKEYPGTLKFSDLMEAGSDASKRQIVDLQDTLQFDEPINIQFTSGTTGFPKGATLSHHNIVNNSFFIGIKLDYHNRPARICVPVPLYHCFGMVIGCLQIPNHGATCVFPGPGFDPGAALRAVELEKCTALYGVPTMFIDMLNHPEFHKFNLSSLYTGVMAGSPCPVETMRQVIAKMHMDEVTVCYGTTENSPVTFQSNRDDAIEKRVTTVGRAHPHVEAKIIGEDGRVVPVGTIGELCTRGYTTMLGYWGDDNKTREHVVRMNLRNIFELDRVFSHIKEKHKMGLMSIDERTRAVGLIQGWGTYRDTAIMDEDGYVQISGRIKDMIIRGGENIYPLEIEQVLYTNPKIKDVQIIGVPDKRLGEEICAWVELKDGEKSTEEEIRQFCRDRIAKFKVPKYVEFVSEFPLTVTGKVQKYKIREQATKSLDIGNISGT